MKKTYTADVRVCSDDGYTGAVVLDAVDLDDAIAQINDMLDDDNGLLCGMLGITKDAPAGGAIIALIYEGDREEQDYDEMEFVTVATLRSSASQAVH